MTRHRVVYESPIRRRGSRPRAVVAQEVGNLLPGERVHTADGWWFRSGEGSEAGKYFFKNEAPSAPGGYMRAAENPRSRRAPREHIEPGVKTIFVFREQEPYSASGFAYRAYRADKTPLYIGAESMRELEGKLKDHLLGRDPDFMPSYRVVKMPADFE